MNTDFELLLNVCVVVAIVCTFCLVSFTVIDYRHAELNIEEVKLCE